MRFSSVIVGMGVSFVVGCGTSAGAPKEPRSPAAAPVPRQGSNSEPTAAASGPRTKTATADDLEAAKLENQFAITRQVDALERSIELYRMFIERAGDDPEYAEAVERSRNRIEDAKVTICFLLEKPCDESSR